MEPKYAGMFGGELLEISGQCLDEVVTIICNFGMEPLTVTSEGFKVTSMKLKCPVPRLTQRGTVLLAVHMYLENGRTYKSEGEIYIGKGPTI